MSSFWILFFFSVISFAIHPLKNRKLFALLGVVGAIAAVFFHIPMGMEGFGSTSAIELFEMVLLGVVFGVVVSEEEPLSITQTLFITTASIALLEAQTMIGFILSFEALSIISFVLVSHIKDKKTALGAMRLYLAGALATGLVLFGTALYLLDGFSLNESLHVDGRFSLLGIWMILSGVFYKLTVIPMHTWATQSYALIKPSHAAVLSAITKAVVVVAVFHFFMPFLEHFRDFNQDIFIVLALVTMTLGNILALFQKHIGKILAYSSVAHAGYMLLGFVALQSSYASYGVLYIAITYMITQSAIFILLDILSKGSNTITLNDLKGLSSKDKKSAFFLSIQLFSLAGIPLLGGFLAKAVLVYAVVDANLWIVALITLLNSALSVGYYAWIIKHIYFDSPADVSLALQKLNSSAFFAQVLLMLAILFFGIFAYSIFNITFS